MNVKYNYYIKKLSEWRSFDMNPLMNDYCFALAIAEAILEFENENKVVHAVEFSVKGTDFKIEIQSEDK